MRRSQIIFNEPGFTKTKFFQAVAALGVIQSRETGRHQWPYRPTVKLQSVTEITTGESLHFIAARAENAYYFKVLTLKSRYFP